MASPAVLDFAKLLAAIPGPPNGDAAGHPGAPVNPAGVDLEAGGVTPSLSAIRAARNAARNAEDEEAKREKGKPAPPEWRPPNWRPVVELGTLALAEKSKHLDVAAYLIEALARSHGFAGLRDGLRLARELVEKYWDHIYPLPDEEGLKTRVNVLGQVLLAVSYGSLIMPLSRVPLTEKPLATGPINLYAYQEALKLSNPSLDPKLRQRRIEEGIAPLEKLREVANESTPEFYVSLVADLTACLEELGKLGMALDERCTGKLAREDEPGISTLRSFLEKCLEAVKDIAQDRLPATPAGDQPVKAEAAPAAARPAAAPPEQLDVIRDREDAFRILAKIAEFFKRTEPQSVIPHALEQVIRWGRMPLADLLSELIPDDNPRKNLFQRVGIRATEAGKGDSKK